MPKPTKNTKTTKSPAPTSKANFFAIFSDIHGNIDALEAVLADMDGLPVRGMFCLGDIVGYGPEPGACVKRVMDLCAVTVLGNHEAMLLLADKILDEDWDEPIRNPLRIAKEQVSKAGVDVLHEGRNVAVEGEDAGAVESLDHLDAQFAISECMD
jgi:predicted phosphodiesterase